jgi:hypothetical protein
VVAELAQVSPAIVNSQSAWGRNYAYYDPSAILDMAIPI